MPRLNNRRAEKMAQYEARGMSTNAAALEAGFKVAAAGYAWSRRTEYRDRVAELLHKAEVGKMTESLDSRPRVLADMDFLWEWCVRINEIEEPCERCGTKFEKLWDMKHALKIIEFRGLEQGMFKRQLDVTSRKSQMIEGSEEQITTMLAQLIQRLGVPFLARLLERVGYDSAVEAMQLAGYQVTKPNGRDAIEAGSSSGYGGEARESDVEPLRTAPEAGGLS